MKLAAYIRVSTETQVYDGYGLEVQRDSIGKWAKANGHRVVRWCSDEGVSGALDALDREGLTCVLDAIESGEAQGAVVARLDRLARKLTVQEAALAHVWQSGGRVFTVDGGEVLQDDDDDPMRTAMRQMAGVFAQLDRAMIAKRLRDGRRKKAAKGGYAYGSPALGFRSDKGELVEDPDEKATLDRVAELHRQGRSLREIASVLTAEGMTPKRAASKGSHWHPETLRRIIARAGSQRSADLAGH